MSLTRVRSIRLHPIHWFAEHPLVLALLIAILITAAIVALANRADTGIRIDTLRPLDYPAMMHLYGCGAF
ncbi:MAG: hypothetical protein ISR85_03205 [Kiritimatiellales bacterium]|nr:hypothetical protein [Kiritimatiellota bacterium]MBL7011921.1 hypothetical protein [Kiritimatiellales bacterium]